MPVLGAPEQVLALQDTGQGCPQLWGAGPRGDTRQHPAEPAAAAAAPSGLWVLGDHAQHHHKPAHAAATGGIVSKSKGTIGLNI